MEEIKTSHSYARDLKHALQVENSVELSEESLRIITKTIQEAQHTADRNAIDLMRYWRTLSDNAREENRVLRGEVERYKTAR